MIAGACLLFGCVAGVGIGGAETAKPVAAPSSVAPTVTVTETATVRPVEATPSEPVVTPSPRPTQKAKPTPRPKPRKTARPAPRTDPRFPTCTAAKAAGYGHYRVGEPEYSWYEDRDRDGVVCE
ncbi:excalibur calcium-binding domain-containing protein [Actinomadura sp. 3N508]|uniref:excalibur calcium-binding domain-containing protein n=1 Tax=Actinomadura sp. 3N508 TaxID=3375153 RepID=UPI0037ACCE69